MKPRLLVFSLLAAFGAGCTSMDKPASAVLHVEPVMSVRHGAPVAQSYYQLGRYYQGQGRQKQAEDAYLKAITADEQHVDALNALGSLYAERGELERATQIFEKAVAMTPDAAYLHNNLGFARYLLGRLDDAYAAVYMALSLDATLARGWANLEEIARASGDSGLVAAAKAQRFAGLPFSLPVKGSREVRVAEASPVQSPEILPETNARSETVAQMPEKTASQVEESGSAGIEPPPSAPKADMVAALSENKEKVQDPEPIPVIQGKLVCPLPANSGDSGLTLARLEVSNANGVTGFARTFSSQLKKDSLPVARITNFGSFLLKTTVIEYQPGFEVATCALVSRIGMVASLVPATQARPRSDIRIVLGKDALPSGVGGFQPHHIAAEGAGGGIARGA